MKRNRGFTLMELMIVITVIAILAALAITSYAENVRKGKRSGALRAVMETQLAMEKWRANCPSYADDTAGTNNCKDRNGDGDGSDAGTDAVYVALPTSDYYTLTLSNLAPTTYTITATKKSTFSDPKCGNFVLTYNAGVASKTIDAGDINYCWRN